MNSVFTRAEHCMLLTECNNVQILYQESTCIHRLFEAQVENTPDAVALIYEGREITYRRLNALANQFAHYLQRSGVGPEVLVGICMERSLEMIVGLLGVLKAGGAYVPLDPTYPQERLVFLLQDARIALLVTHKRLLLELAGELSKYTERIIGLDANWEILAQENEENVTSEVDVHNLAYVIYTSGSRGKPKGVLITHKNLFHSILAHMRCHEPVTCLLLLVPFVFDVAAGSIFTTLCQGGTLVLPRTKFELEMSYLASLIAQYHVSDLMWTPFPYALLIEQAEAKALSSLRTITIGGEPLPKRLLERHYELLPQATLFNAYGPTETTIWSSVYQCQPQQTGVTVPIGRPMPGTQIYLLDSTMHPVPVGVPGELYIGGDGVARGYLNNSRLTAEKFMLDHFSNRPGAQLYRTGDLACYHPDGNIEFLGRIDQQVKIRGFRIELGEIEAVLEQLTGIRQAVVVAREDTPGDKRLVAYIIADQEQKLSLSSMQKILAEKLPVYMLPAAFVLLDALPLTINGKIDHRALPPADSTNTLRAGTRIAPRTVTEEQLCKTMATLLGLDEVGIDDNFFLLGGHSLLGTKLIAHISEIFAVNLTTRSLLDAPTVRALAHVVEQLVLTKVNTIDDGAGENGVARVSVVAVQPGIKSKTPFFFFHGDPNEGPFYCFKLAQLLGTDQPFYACAPYRFVSGEALPTFEAMAIAHVEAIRAVQPEGPYLLGGFCNGALVAYEVAHQLLAANQRVDLLFMVDPVPPAHRKWVRNISIFLPKLFRMQQEWQLDWFLRSRYVYRYMRFPEERKYYHKHMTVSGRHLSRFAILKALILPSAYALHENWFDLYRWLVAAYEPPAYPGKVTFVWTDKNGSGQRAWSLILKASCREVHILDSGHLNWVVERLDDLAELLRTSLAQRRRIAKDSHIG
jgi:amino acid adenylation domain-containing protein